jgi:hypothetical protein
MMRRVILGMLITSLFLGASFATAQITVQSLSNARIDFDGVPNEAAWEQSEVLDDFTQKELIAGAAPSERTEIRFLYDDDNLYIGITCYDSDPAGIVSKQLKRDQEPGSDDHVSFIISTFDNKRTGYLFSTNPNGLRYDATVPGANDNDISNPNWNGMWDSRGAITEFGWTAEVIIPFKTLRFPATPTQVWGFNVMRTIRRKNEQVLWHAWERDDTGIYHLSKTGTIAIKQLIEQSRQFEVKPYILTGAEDTSTTGPEEEFKYGMNLRYNISSNTQVHLTTRTDFAQIEDDREVINLTRFDIRYPEKRDFFLENNDMFEFSHGFNRIFYSRRIGLTSARQPVPILGGAKISHTAGRYRLGVMSMQTEEEFGQPSTNYSIARLKRDIWDKSHIGLVATSVMDADGHDNQLFGGEFVYRTDKFRGNRNFQIQSYLVGTLTDGKGYNSIAGRIFFRYPNDEIDAYILYHGLGMGYNPEMGYISREAGVQQYEGRVAYTPRTNIPHLKKLSFMPFAFNFINDTRNKLITRNLTSQVFGFITEADDEFGVTIRSTYDYLVMPFGIFKDVVIPVGSYEWVAYRTSIQTSERRPFSVLVKTESGDFYNGTRNMADAELTFKRSKFWALSAYVTYNDLDIGDRGFITREFGSRTVVDFSTRLNTSTFLQWNSQTREINLNFRIHFIPKIGSDIYLVYNHLWDEKEDLLTRDRYDYYTIRNTGLFKVDYTYRF